ncbi:MAG: flavodoxin family protein [Dehalococcoidales bacterium]|nr:flavodoxin family protein [Dehalococcoidales bacterium]
MKITAINTSPRKNWNTAQLIKEAVKGAESKGAEIVYFDLYQQERFTGCISCFGCKRKPNEGKCVYKDGILPILQSIRESDAVIIGTPNYLGQPSAGFRALYERIVFQNLTYRVDVRFYEEYKKPTLFIMTSNVPEEGYQQGPYAEMIKTYQAGLSANIGPTEVFICGNTLQVKDYSIYNWNMFDSKTKEERHKTVFPQELRNAYELGANLVRE